MSNKPRILVLQPDRGLAESIYRALKSMRGLSAEVDVAPAGEVHTPGIRLDRYQLLVVDQETADRGGLNRGGVDRGGGDPATRQSEGANSSAAPAAPPFLVITVGGPPSGRPRTGNELFRVPLPLSFNLLEESVKALLGGLPVTEEEETRRKDSVG